VVKPDNVLNNFRRESVTFVYIYRLTIKQARLTWHYRPDWSNHVQKSAS